MVQCKEYIVRNSFISQLSKNYHACLVRKTQFIGIHTDSSQISQEFNPRSLAKYWMN